jgi:hypothetical protein
LELTKGSSGRSPTAFIISIASSSFVRLLFPALTLAQYLHPPPLDLTDLYDGLTSLPQTKHLHLQDFDAPGKSIRGFSLAFFINFTASSEWTAFPEQNPHFTPLDLTLLKLGETSLLHLMHRDFHGVDEDS